MNSGAPSISPSMLEAGSLASSAKCSRRNSAQDIELVPMPLSQKPLPPTPEPPNGGFQAWLQIAGGFCLYFNSWGLVSAFGIFQTVYETGPLSHLSPFEVSIIGSLQTFLMVLLCLFVGPVYDAGYFRLIVLVGSALVVVGTLLQSFSVYYWQFLLTQGLMVGVGASCLCMTSVTIPSMWFTTGLPLANGAAASGSGLGGVLLPIMVRRLEKSVGLHWAIRAVTLLILVLLTFANLVLRPRGVAALKRKPRSLIDKTVFADTPFILFVLGASFSFMGMYTPFVYVQNYALAEEITSNSLAFYLLAIINASSIAGRILPTLFAKKIGSLNLVLVTVVVLSITAYCFSTATSLPRLMVAAIVYGFWSGTFFAAMPTIFVRLTNNPAAIGTRMGMSFAVLSIPILFGPPVSGAIQDALGFRSMWLWAGSLMLAGFITMGVARIAKVGYGLKAV